MVTTLLDTLFKSVGTDPYAPIATTINAPNGSMVIQPTADGGFNIQVNW